MSDDKHTPAAQAGDQTQPVRPASAPADPPAAVQPAAATGAGAPAYAAVPTSAAGGGGRRGFRDRFRRLRTSHRDRTFGLAALIASALAGVIIGGLGSAAVHAVTDDGPRDRAGWVRHGDDRGPGSGGTGGGPHGVPGQLSPTTAPEDDSIA